MQSNLPMVGEGRDIALRCPPSWCDIGTMGAAGKILSLGSRGRRSAPSLPQCETHPSGFYPPLRPRPFRARLFLGFRIRECK